MAHQYAKTMFSEAAKRLQEQYGSRGQYRRMEESGATHDRLGMREAEFIDQRDSMYLASVTPDGWPYVQHRGGPKGFLRVLDERTVAFADFAGNKQYITAGNLATNDRVALFLMDYPEQARLKIDQHHARHYSGGGEEDTLRMTVGHLGANTCGEKAGRADDYSDDARDPRQHRLGNTINRQQRVGRRLHVIEEKVDDHQAYEQPLLRS